MIGGRAGIRGVDVSHRSSKLTTSFLKLRLKFLKRVHAAQVVDAIARTVLGYQWRPGKLGKEAGQWIFPANFVPFFGQQLKPFSIVDRLMKASSPS